MSRFGKIGVKTSLLFVLFALILCLSLSVFSYYASYQAYSDFYSTSARQTAAMAANMVDGDVIAEYLSTREIDEYYAELKATFDNIKREQNVMYLYIFSPSPDLDKFTYILEASLETDNAAMIAALGEDYDFKELELTYLVPDIIAGRASSQKVIARQSDYGANVAAWAPVFNSNGDMVAMVEADLSLDLVYSMLNQYMKRIVIISSVIIILMVAVLALSVHRMVTRPLSTITEGARHFVSGDTLSYDVAIKTGDEMEILSDALFEMSQNLENYTKRLSGIAADKERLATELDVASNIQNSLLPKPISGRDDFSIGALIASAEGVGRTFYDFFFIDQRRFCIVTAEVSGSGIPAALFMVVAKTMIKNQMMTGMHVEEAMSILNSRLYESISGDMTVSAFVGVLDIPARTLAYVNAGQGFPLLAREGVSYEFMREQATSQLAESPNVKYRRMELSLRQGDRLYLYTAGAEKLTTPEGKALGTKQLRTTLNLPRFRDLPPEIMLNDLREELSIYTRNKEHSDDIAMMVLEYAKGDKQQSEITVTPYADSYSNVLPFIKRQLSENGLGGAFYAMLSVTLEELFVLAAARADIGGLITVRCNVYDRRVEVRLIYSGNLNDPRETKDENELNALAFITKNSEELNYNTQDGKNVLTLINTSV